MIKQPCTSWFLGGCSAGILLTKDNIATHDLAIFIGKIRQHPFSLPKATAPTWFYGGFWLFPTS
ncbi:tmem97 [Gossypium australe]|uniref:Tmem97 n=1 Tax=Gossypium australe TaxID=47621 RepID=A0A5B6WNU2_9ROSI|nr:tmem97 [Gossypium australe]